MSQNTIKYEYTEGCANERIPVLSIQSYVKDESGKINSAKYDKIKVEHAANDITLKAVSYDFIRDNSGKIVERRDVKVNGNEELTH